MRQRKNQQDNWAAHVPDSDFHSPYRDYGWEQGQSALPEFRDPSIDYMPYERQDLGPWQQGRHIVSAGGHDARRHAHHPGPHVGKGPRNYTRSDERIYEEVCDRMTEHGGLDATNIGVSVEGGDVTLKGTVPDRHSKQLAEDIVDTVFGVQDVHNELKLQRSDNTPARWRDEVGHSGVYPASAEQEAPNDATAQGEASWGQGKRGAQGYNDSGRSELHLPPNKKNKE
jgi:hypothetical protein